MHLPSLQPPEPDPRGMEIAADPDVVWHYTDGAGLISILTGHCLWATSAAFLNDQAEIGLGVERLAKRFLELTAGEDGDTDLAKFSAALDPRRPGGASPANCFILSASRAWDSLAMWRLYGGSQESYAIGIDSTARLGVLGDGSPATDELLGASGVYLKRRPWEPVRYRQDDQAALVDTVFEGLPLQMRELKAAFNQLEDRPRSIGTLPEATRRKVQDVLDDLEQAVLLIKHEGFADEREVRQAVVMLADRGNPEANALEARLLRYRATGYGIAPYVCLTGGGSDDAVTDRASHLPVRAIAISPSPNGAAAEDSVSRLLAANGYCDVPVIRSGIPFRG